MLPRAASMDKKLKQASNQAVDQITGAAIPSRAVATIETFRQSLLLSADRHLKPLSRPSGVTKGQICSF